MYRSLRSYRLPRYQIVTVYSWRILTIKCCRSDTLKEPYTSKSNLLTDGTVQRFVRRENHELRSPPSMYFSSFYLRNNRLNTLP